MPSGGARGQLPQTLAEEKGVEGDASLRALTLTQIPGNSAAQALSWPLGNSSSASFRKPSLINTQRGKSLQCVPMGERDKDTSGDTETERETERALGGPHGPAAISP